MARLLFYYYYWILPLFTSLLAGTSVEGNADL